MKFSNYLAFDGTCKDAFETYQKIFGGDLRMMTYGEMPGGEPVPENQKNRIMHARLTVGGEMLMGGDAPPPHFSQPQGFSVSVMVDDAAEGKRIFDALSENGKIMMAYDKTFWAEGFGMLIDRFGTPWMVNAGMMG